MEESLLHSAQQGDIVWNLACAHHRPLCHTTLLQLSQPGGSLLDLLLSTPLGEDSTGAKYYHLPGYAADLRVYKQLPGGGSSIGQVQWATQATTLQQLQAWDSQLASSSDARDQALRAALAQVRCVCSNEG